MIYFSQGQFAIKIGVWEEIFFNSYGDINYFYDKPLYSDSYPLLSPRNIPR